MGLEPTGIASIFKRSITANNLRYTNYIEHGNCSTFNTIKESKLYDDTTITNLEFVEHIQEYLATRCCKLRVTWKRRKLSDEKVIMGAGCLNDKAINTLLNYYEMAIRNNVGDLYGMKKSVQATFFFNCDIYSK